MPKGTRGRSSCAVDGCERVATARGWCQNHDRAWRLYGDPLTKRNGMHKFCTLDGCTRLHESNLRAWAKEVLSLYGEEAANGG